MREKLLEVKDLAVSYHGYAGEVQSVRRVSFDVNRGETLAVVGESGCGKSVTAKTIMHLIKTPPAEIKEGSQVLFNGEDVLRFDKKRLSQYRGGEAAIIFQDALAALNPTMTVGNQIVENIRHHSSTGRKEAMAKAVELLRMVGIPQPEQRVKQYPHEFSGGMRQRVMIAIALACQPQLLIADEPTTALDVTIQAQIIDLLRELKKELNTAIILVTHDLGVVANFADRIQVMYAGQVVERGSVREIFYEAQHPYTWALLSSVPKLAKETKQELYTLQGTPPDLILPLNHCPFAARCEYCMQICKEQMPSETTLSDTHQVSCWLQHPDAPKVKSFYDREGK